jgi:hypothetical protein
MIFQAFDFSSEFWLICLIVVYVLVATGIGYYRLRKFHREHPGERGKNYQFTHDSSALTLAGFSITAIAVLVSIGYRNIVYISSTLAFFSLAFLFLILAPTINRLKFIKFFSYIANVFFDAGLLSIACGFLESFGKNVSWTDWSTIIFAILVIALMIFSLANFLFVESVIDSGRLANRKRLND